MLGVPAWKMAGECFHRASVVADDSPMSRLFAVASLPFDSVLSASGAGGCDTRPCPLHPRTCQRLTVFSETECSAARLAAVDKKDGPIWAIFSGPRCPCACFVLLYRRPARISRLRSSSSRPGLCRRPWRSRRLAWRRCWLQIGQFDLSACAGSPRFRPAPSSSCYTAAPATS